MESLVASEIAPTDTSRTLANNILVLEQSEGQAMVGRLVPADDDAFNFTLIGGPPGDEGLDFRRRAET